MTRAFHLVVVPASGRVAHVPLDKPIVRIGSDSACEVMLSDPEIAPLHARIEAQASGHVLVREQLPLLVNGLRSKAHLLAPNDMVVLGKNAVAYRSGDVPTIEASSPGPRTTDALRRLHAFAERIQQHDDAADLADRLLADVLALTGASRGTLVRFTADDDPVRVATATHGSFSGGEVVFSRTLVNRMRDEGRAILMTNSAIDPAMARAESFVGSAQSAIVAPIVAGWRVLGALYASAQADALGRIELELLELYASLSGNLLESERKTEQLERALRSLGEDTSEDESLLIGTSRPMQEVRRTLRKIAGSSAPVLITGETGTGKELAARELHRLSPRASRPFIAVNCGAIPHELLTSELFGHVKGAFTQAHKDRLGFFRSAEGGTLFLDEIGEMPIAQQVALLRVLQEGEVTPVGAERGVPVDVRVVCATNRTLESEVTVGRFRQDLLFRIAVVRLTLPALRDRAEDIVQLAQFFLRREARTQGERELRFSDAALRALRRARWEGNVRELEAAVRRGVLLRDGLELRPADLNLGATEAADEPEGDVVRPLAMARDEFLRGYVKSVVERFGGNRTAAAEALVVTPRTVFKYLEE